MPIYSAGRGRCSSTTPITSTAHDGERRLKVVVFGSYHSGKTSLIRAINPSPCGTEVRNRDGTTTVAFDLGIREHRGFKIYFYGTPGQERFEVAREVVAFGLHIGLVDRRCHEGHDRVRAARPRRS